jgi:MYXO-CTERM domain-containing protein
MGVNTTGTTTISTSTFNLTAGTFTFNSSGTGFVTGGGAITTRNSAINVSGGLLDMNGKPINAVSTGTGTSVLSLTGGVIANAGTIGNFTTLTFTGGTLRDAATVSRAVTQSGVGSLLEITSAAAGTGTAINGDYSLSGGSASVAARRILSITGNLALDPTAGGSLGVTLDGANGKYAGTGSIGLTSTTSDKLVVTPLSDITSETTYTIATFSGYAPGDFDFEQVVLAGNVATQNLESGQPNYVLVTYNPADIQIKVNNVTVPQPAGAGALAIAAIGLLARRRRRR